MANRDDARAVECPSVAPKLERPYNLAVLDELEMVHPDGPAHRDPEGDCSWPRSSGRCARLPPLELEAEERAVARKSAAPFKGFKKRPRAGVAAGVQKHPV